MSNTSTTRRRSIARALALTLTLVPLVAAAAIDPRPAAAAGPAAATAATTPVKGPSVEGITEYRLPNGLRILLFPDQSKATATVNVTYLVGSRHEGYGESGMAHLLEHLVFKGTPKHPNIVQELTARGTRPNGSTWYDRTNYFETFAATDENLEWALDLEADRMVNSFIAKKDLDSEFSVVRNEFEAGENDPTGVMIERVLSTMYLWHNYGKSTIGSREDIERVPIERLQAFYRKWYQPDNAVLIVAGKFDEAKTLRLIGEKFGAIPRPQRPLEQTFTVEPAQDGERSVSLRRVGDIQAVAVGYHVPSGSHADWAAVEVMTSLLGDTPNGRLHEALVESQKATQVFGWAKEGFDPSFVIFGAQLRKEKSIDEVRQGLLDTVHALATNPPSDKEVTRARDALLRDWETTMRNSERAAISLSEWIGVGDWRLVFLHRDRLEQVTAADVTRVAQSYLKPENRTVGTFVPTTEAQRAEIPAPPNVAALTKFYKGREALAQGEAFDTAPAAIEARLERSTLAAGARLTLLPKKTRGATVAAAMTFHFGDETTLTGKADAGTAAAAMLLRGTSKRTREEIREELDRLKSQLQITGGPSQVIVNVETTREHLPAVLRLAIEVLRDPSFPAAEFEQLRQESLAQAEDAKADPTQKALTALRRHLTPWPAADPRYVKTMEETIAGWQALQLDEVKAFWRDFHGASNAEIAVVGDFDKAEVAKLLAEGLGDWASRAPYRRLDNPYRDVGAANQRIEAPDKENAMFVAGQNLALQDTDADYPAMVLANFMTGGGFLNSRLAVRLRQKEGYSYGAGSQLQASPFEASGFFLAYAIYNPGVREKLEAAYLEEIRKVLDEGFTESEIAEAKSGWLQQRTVSRGMDRELARGLATRDYQGRTLEFDARLEERIGALGAAEILAAWRKHIDPKKMALIQAGDFAKAEKAGGAP